MLGAAVTTSKIDTSDSLRSVAGPKIITTLRRSGFEGMLWAQMQPNNQMQADAMLAGAACMGVTCAILVATAGIIVGVMMQRNPRAGAQPYIAYAAGGVGALISGVLGFLFGCIGGLPVSLLFIVGIVVLLATVPSGGSNRRGRRDRYYDEDEDDYDDRPRPRRRRFDEVLDDEDEDRPRRRRRRDLDDY